MRKHNVTNLDHIMYARHNLQVNINKSNILARAKIQYIRDIRVSNHTAFLAILIKLLSGLEILYLGT
jgi:hypothetical protein